MSKDEPPEQTSPDEQAATKVIHLHVREDLYRAFQRCIWIIINETGRNQIDVMNEMVHDFLVKHQC